MRNTSRQRALSVVDRDLLKRYEDWHWGNKPRELMDVRVPGLAKTHPVVQLGLLTELHFDALSGLRLPKVSVSKLTSEAAEKPSFPQLSAIAIAPKDYMNNHLIFDAAHPKQRLYAVLSPAVRKDTKKLWSDKWETETLYGLASLAGGHHADDDDYPKMAVQPLGFLYYATYYTLKEDENGKPSPSKYIHRMGEEGGKEPVLAVSKAGDLYIAGGTYTCPNAGITR